eukprot:984854-Prymnesium_polylepis.1
MLVSARRGGLDAHRLWVERPRRAVAPRGGTPRTSPVGRRHRLSVRFAKRPYHEPRVTTKLLLLV